MFHRYITASSGRKIDFDRAALLMDQELFHKCHRNVIKTYQPVGFNTFDLEIATRMNGDPLQLLWIQYCYAHKIKYNEPFEPDVSMTWDAKP